MMLTGVANFDKQTLFSPMAEQTQEILTISEVAEYLKVAERTIYRLAAARKIPAFKVGGTWRFAKADIEKWIREQTGASEDDNHVPDRGEDKQA